MDVLRLGTAIRPLGAKDDLTAEGQVALALATTAVPRLRSWLAARSETDSEIERVERRLRELQSVDEGEGARFEEERDSREEELLRLRAELRHIEDRPWPVGRRLWILLWGGPWQIQRDAARKRLERKDRTLNALVARRAEEIRELEAARDALQQRRSELEAVPRVIDGVRALDCLFLPRVVHTDGPSVGQGDGARRWILADPLGEPVRIDAPELAVDPQTLDELACELRSVEFKGALLSADGEADVTPGQNGIVGDERHVIDLVEKLDRIVRSATYRAMAIPLLSAEAPESRYLVSALRRLGSHARPVRTEVDRGGFPRLSDTLEAADELERMCGGASGVSAAVLTRLAESASGLATAFAESRRFRERSAVLLGHGVHRTRLNSILSRYYLFCPECNALPRYLTRAYGIADADMRRLSTEALRPGLSEYLRRRLSSAASEALSPDDEPLVRGRWHRALKEMDRLEEECRGAQSELLQLEAETEFTAEERLLESVIGRRIGELKARYQQLVRGLLANPLATSAPEGDSAAPALGPTPPPQGSVDFLSRPLPDPGSRLVYDPAAAENPWSCRRCGVSFDLDTALVGAIDRIRHDVVYPMVSGLWASEPLADDVREAVDQANRAIQDRAQQTLQMVGEPIADFATEAERLEARVAEANGRGRLLTQRLVQVAQQFGRFGLLPEEEMERVRSTAGKTVDRMDAIVQSLARLVAAQREMTQAVEALRHPSPAEAAPYPRFVDEDLAAYGPFEAVMVAVDAQALSDPDPPSDADIDRGKSPQTSTPRWRQPANDQLERQTSGPADAQRSERARRPDA